jgi:hypothetical protein
MRSAPASTRLTAQEERLLLSRVLNDWPDRETTAILISCTEAGRPSGVVLAVGGAAADDAARGLTIEMVCLGGSTDPWRGTGAVPPVGLDVTAAGLDRSGRFVVECRG